MSEKKKESESPQVIKIGQVEFPLWIIIAVIAAIGFLGLIALLMRGGGRLVV